MTTIEEIWKPVVGFEGLYEVSNQGRVKAMFIGNHGQFKPGRILKPQPHRNEYLFVGLYRPGTRSKSKARSIHSLVLEAFKGERKPKQVCRHLDGIRTNNTVDNLEWGTSAENADDAKRHGTFVLGEKNGFSILTVDKVREIRRLRKEGMTYTALAGKFSTHWTNVRLIALMKTWNHITCTA